MPTRVTLSDSSAPETKTRKGILKGSAGRPQSLKVSNNPCKTSNTNPTSPKPPNLKPNTQQNSKPKHKPETLLPPFPSPPPSPPLFPLFPEEKTVLPKTVPPHRTARGGRRPQRAETPRSEGGGAPENSGEVLQGEFCDVGALISRTRLWGILYYKSTIKNREPKTH